MSKKVLLIHPKRKSVISTTPHLGLAMLSAMLKARGHQVLVIDYFLFHDEPKTSQKYLEVITKFKPDIIGISLYTGVISCANEIISNIRAITSKPIMVGGPHATLYAQELGIDNRINYIVRNEAELSIAKVVENSKMTNSPVIIDSPIPDVNELPFPDFTAFLNYEKINTYPLLTSRGCPYNCSFCAVGKISTKKWRSRNPSICIEELEQAQKILPNLTCVDVIDDCPTANPKHFKEFLKRYIDKNINLRMSVANFRAKGMDEELLDLLKAARNDKICIAAEHADPQVFELIDKGETLDDIKKAAKLIKSKGLELYLCFIIGLPKDSLSKTRSSIALAKKLKPKRIIWNMAHPFQSTRMREWFIENGGKLYSDIDHTSWIDLDFRCEEPAVETPDFTREERKKAHFLAVVETDQYSLRRCGIFNLAKYSIKYGYILPAVKSIFRKTLSLFK